MSNDQIQSAMTEVEINYVVYESVPNLTSFRSFVRIICFDTELQAEMFIIQAMVLRNYNNPLTIIKEYAKKQN